MPRAPKTCSKPFYVIYVNINGFKPIFREHLGRRVDTNKRIKVRMTFYHATRMFDFSYS